MDRPSGQILHDLDDDGPPQLADGGEGTTPTRTGRAQSPPLRADASEEFFGYELTQAKTAPAVVHVAEELPRATSEGLSFVGGLMTKAKTDALHMDDDFDPDEDYDEDEDAAFPTDFNAPAETMAAGGAPIMEEAAGGGGIPQMSPEELLQMQMQYAQMQMALASGALGGSDLHPDFSMAAGFPGAASAFPPAFPSGAMWPGLMPGAEAPWVPAPAGEEEEDEEEDDGAGRGKGRRRRKKRKRNRKDKKVEYWNERPDAGACLIVPYAEGDGETG